ncbi:MAG: SDR family oxidoreductase [Pseudomonadota bacterium]|nr:SDR family oxidoreductase [Pseudomonadota bacterium]
MKLGLEGKVVLITGAGAGIGQALAIAFALEGALVAVNDRSHEEIGDTLAMILAADGKAVAAPFDVSDLDAVGQAIAGIALAIGPVDVLVNNAAVMLANKPFVETDPADSAREIAVGLFGTMHCSRAVLPAMIERRGGAIVNIVSDAGRTGQAREVGYSSAKGGVMSFTKSLAREVGQHGIRVNAVSPAATDTPLRRAMLERMAQTIGADAVAERERKIRRAYPLGRIAKTDDIADSVLFLSSSRAAMVTGQIVSVNGGYAMPG